MASTNSTGKAGTAGNLVAVRAETMKQVALHPILDTNMIQIWPPEVDLAFCLLFCLFRESLIHARCQYVKKPLNSQKTSQPLRKSFWHDRVEPYMPISHCCHGEPRQTQRLILAISRHRPVTCTGPDAEKPKKGNGEPHGAKSCKNAIEMRNPWHF